jgi:effector-binding domain-containing protein
VQQLLPIGRFSQVCRLTVKALRHYDELGLLTPASVDPDSGYRYYSLKQAPDAERIRLLRSLGLPLDDISALVRARDPEMVREGLRRHRSRVEVQLQELHGVLASLERLIEQKEPLMPYEVTVKELQPQPVVSIRLHGLENISEVMGPTLGELFGYIAQSGGFPAGPPFTIYPDTEVAADEMDFDVCVPVSRLLTATDRIDACELPGGRAAATVHMGPYTDVGGAYQALMTWIQAHGHETAGPPREVYLTDPSQVDDPAQLRTEVLWPIREG